jgi:hypothetical protein
LVAGSGSVLVGRAVLVTLLVIVDGCFRCFQAAESACPYVGRLWLSDTSCVFGIDL